MEKIKNFSEKALAIMVLVCTLFWLSGFYYLKVVFIVLAAVALFASFIPALIEKTGIEVKRKESDKEKSSSDVKKEEVKPAEKKAEISKTTANPAAPKKAVELTEKEKQLSDLDKDIDKALDDGNVEKANNLIGKYAKLQAEIENEKKAASEAAKKAEETAKAIADARARFEAMKKK